MKLTDKEIKRSIGFEAGVKFALERTKQHNADLLAALVEAKEALGDARANLEFSTPESKMACQNLIERALDKINKLLE